MSNSVLQPWVENIPWKQQSILFSSLRGPDQDYLEKIKTVSRWMRMVTQNNADPAKPYMNVGLAKFPEPSELDKELEHCTVHFVHHFADGLAIIAHNHPVRVIAKYAAEMHFHIAEELFHFVPETPSTFHLRHRDKKDGIDHHAAVWEAESTAARGRWMSFTLARFNKG